MPSRLAAIVTLFLAIFLLAAGRALPAQAEGPVVHAVLFYSPTCPHCHEVMDKHLPPLFEKYGDRLQILGANVMGQDGNALYQSAIKTYNIPLGRQGYPTLIVGDVVLVGSLEIPQQFPGLIEQYMAQGGVDWPQIPGLEALLATIFTPTPSLAGSTLPTATPTRSSGSSSEPTATPTGGTTPAAQLPAGPQPTPIPTLTPAVPTARPPEKHLLPIPFYGDIDLDAHSLWFSTALIGLVDGFNPCSLWVLSLLLALVVNTGSRFKTLLVGATFLVVATGIYGLIIVGLFNVLAFIGYALWIRIAVALIALAFAAINIKDYFWFKQGVSLTIADESKPKLYRDMRGILAPGKSGLALIGATAAMALGITLVEMPCTAGLPILWTKLIVANNIGGIVFALLLGLYLLMFVLDELVVFAAAVVTLKASRLEEKQGRILKLIGGTVMLVLAIVLLIDPTWMDSIINSLVIFGVAIVTALLVLLVHRRVLPQLGITIGSERLG